MDRINGADWIDLGDGRRGFRDENLPNGILGTEVNALWLNMVQEEILKIITEAGIVPGSGNWTQLWQALNIHLDALFADVEAAFPFATSPEAIAGLLTDKIISPKTLLNALDARPGQWIEADLTINVPADHATLQSAMNWLRSRRISATAVVTIRLAPQQFVVTNESWLVCDHVDGQRIIVTGQPIVSEVLDTDVVASAATTEANLRAKFPTVIKVSGGVGMRFLRGNLRKLSNILLIGDGGTTVNAGVQIGVDDLDRGPFSLLIEDVAVIRFGSFGFQTRVLSKVHARGLTVSHCGNDALWIDQGSIMSGSRYIIGSNTGRGVRVDLQSNFTATGTIDGNTGTGISCENNSSASFLASKIRNNGGTGVYAIRGGAVDVTGSVVTGNNFGVRAIANSYINAGATQINATATSVSSIDASFVDLVAATVTGTITPAANTVGNANSYNKV